MPVVFYPELFRYHPKKFRVQTLQKHPLESQCDLEESAVGGSFDIAEKGFDVIA
jgi:hypothetical protein